MWINNLLTNELSSLTRTHLVIKRGNKWRNKMKKKVILNKDNLSAFEGNKAYINTGDMSYFIYPKKLMSHIEHSGHFIMAFFTDFTVDILDYDNNLIEKTTMEDISKKMLKNRAATILGAGVGEGGGLLSKSDLEAANHFVSTNLTPCSGFEFAYSDHRKRFKEVLTKREAAWITLLCNKMIKKLPRSLLNLYETSQTKGHTDVCKTMKPYVEGLIRRVD